MKKEIGNEEAESIFEMIYTLLNGLQYTTS